MWNILFLFQGLLFVSLLYIVFKSKQRIESVENKMFNIMTIENIITFITEILLQISLRTFGGQDLLSITIILARLYLVGLYVWFCYFSIYTYYITRIKKYEEEDKKNKSYKTSIIALYTSITVGTLLFLTLPIKIMNQENNIYSYGPSVDLLKASIGLVSVLWLFLLLKSRKDIKNKQYAPIYIVIILLIVNVILQTVNPSILIATFTLGFTLYIMFFTIENPDLRMIQQLELAKEQADQANRAKTDFLSSMSHEIRTPLNAISGFSDCILEANTLDEAKENAKDIVDASNTLLEIVNGILDVSKIEAGKMDIVCSPYDSKAVFSELAKLITPRMNDKGLDFSYYIAPDIPKTLYGDHANLKKVVTNLLSNACKYTDKGFVRYEVNCVNMNDYTRLIISVEDSGRGIKKQNIDKMFTKFQRLEEDRNTTIEGTGLGLAITKQLTELMGGKIIVHTIYGKGSKFTVVINQKVSEKEIIEENKYKTTLDLHDVKILIVDDTVLNLKVAKKILENYNANDITTCESGFDCLDKINSGEVYDIILLDDMMPKMSGVETLKELKEIPGFNIPVIALTANAITGMREKYLSDGFSNYLAKPIEKEELIKVINECLGRVVTEQMPIVKEDEDNESSEEVEENKNEIIPVEDNIEEELGKKLDLTFSSEDTRLDKYKLNVDHIDKFEMVNKIETIPVVDINIPIKSTVYDRKYLEDNGVDVSHALELLGDMDMYNSTVNDFLDDIDEKWNRIVEYKNSSDMSNYAIEVHSLKSDSKYLGLMKLADIAYQHELQSKDNNINYVNSNFQELENQYKKDLEIIKNYSRNN